ncbi:GtrA family protein [Lysobacter arenosi]|jgi:putative flippase GtrA|uniref:GtrA family protein n=1 Tax=Lysobacter arenosi TaxID=2795387 RepID=A0ABX7R9F2_9GAMM|nr:GtrA family protein [Lysobacter arenosi]QSX73634.1 GtrA family protein [Lysobacter arenosi]
MLLLSGNGLIARGWQFASSEKGRFLIVGGWNTFAGYLIFAAVHLLVGASLGPTGTLVLAYCIALPQSFITQRLFVFRKRGQWRDQFGRFALSNSIIFASNLAFLPPAVRMTGTDPLAVQAVFVVVSTVASYFIHKHYSFRR